MFGQITTIRNSIQSSLRGLYLDRWKYLEFFLILTIGVFLALLVRYFLLSFVSGDYLGFNSNWYLHIKTNGFSVFKENFSNYTPVYLYMLYIVSLVFPHISTLVAVKLPSILFDFVGAFFIFRTVQLRYKGLYIPTLAFLAILASPTVLLNGAAWGQTDMIFTSFLAGSVYFLMNRKSNWAMACFGLALAVKLQAIFLGPFIVILLLKKQITRPSLLLIPLVFVVTLLPSWIAGRPLMDLLMIYAGQLTEYHHLSLNIANLYAWLPDSYFDNFYLAGLVWGVMISFVFILIGYKSPRPLERKHILELAVASAMIVPFFLPKMHERYFFAADVLSILYGFYFPRRFYIPLGINLASFFSYWPFLFENDLFPLPVVAILSFVILSILVYFTVSDLYRQDQKQPSIIVDESGQT